MNNQEVYFSPEEEFFDQISKIIKYQPAIGENLLLKNLRQYKKAKNYKACAQSYYYLGASQINQTNFYKAEEYLDQGIIYYKKTKNLRGEIRCLMAKGIIYSQLGLIDTSLKEFFIIVKRIPEDSLQDLKAKIYNNIAENYKELKQYEDAFQYYHKAFELGKKYGSPLEIGIYAENIGTLYCKLKDYKNSEQFLLESLHYLSEISEKSEMGYICLKLGKIAQNKKEWDSAQKYFQLSLEKSGITENYDLLVSTLIHQAMLEKEQQNYDHSLAQLNEALKHCEKNGLEKYIPEIFLLRSEIFEIIGQMKNAFEFLRKYIDSQEKINSEKLNQVISRQSQEYHLLQIKKESEIHYLKNIKLKKKNKKLQEINDALKNELILAENIQKQLMPDEFPFIPGLSISGKYTPQKELGGDFYDYYVLSPHKIAIFIADACGHGVFSAFIASILKVFLLQHNSSASSPGKIMSELNASILSLLKAHHYVTGFFCILDLKEKKLVYSNAGHSEPILFKKPNNAISLVSNSPFLGLKKEVKYKENSISFESGDRFVLYTDGITETWMKTNSLFEKSNLIRLLRRYRNNTPEETIIKILKYLKKNQNPLKEPDDRAMIIIDFT